MTFKTDFVVHFILAIAVAAVGMTSTAEAEVIAHWTFDQGDDFLLDSSGNGCHLELNGTVNSVGTAKVGSGSAQFTGAGLLNTIEALDLSPYSEVTLSWYMQMDNTAPSILWELSSGYPAYQGAFVCATRSSSVPDGNGYVAQRYVGGGYEAGYAMDYFPTAVSSEWSQFSARITPGAFGTNKRIEVYQDGTLISTDCWPGDYISEFPSDQKLYVGARAGIQIPFSGLIDDFKIEGVVSPPALEWTLGKPIATYYADRGLTDAMASQMAEGGWNLVWASSVAQLNMAQTHGLRAMWTGPLDDATVSTIRKHPALYAYFVIDEPSADKFPELADTVSRLRELDPSHVAYINLLACNVPPDPWMGTSDYLEYLDQYMSIVQPSLLSYDHYFLLATGEDKPYYFENLAIISHTAKQAGIPFMNIVQACSWAAYVRSPTGNELRYLYYTSLAYGAQGISDYVYSYPNHTGGMALEDGTTTELYDTAKAINPEFAAIAQELQSLHHIGAYHLGDLPWGYGTTDGSSPMRLPDDSPFTLSPDIPDTVYVENQPVRGAVLGFWGSDLGLDDATFALVVNLDYSNVLNTRVNGPGDLSVFDPASGMWIAQGNPWADLCLLPGGGVLVGLTSLFTPGDANHDGMVNEADAALMAENWQTLSGAGWSNGDFNNDGAVNDIDAALMAANWHFGVPANVDVPEPDVLVLLAGAVLAWLVRRWGNMRVVMPSAAAIVFVFCSLGIGQEVELTVSSKAGDRLAAKPSLRFEKETLDEWGRKTPLEIRPEAAGGFLIDDATTDQTIIGFGASFLEAGLICLNALPAEEQAAVLRNLFDAERGACFSAMKTVLAGTDFMSAGPWYTYNDAPGDVEMKHFSIERDFGPNGLGTFIKRARKHGDFVLQAPMDYPPDWMLRNVADNEKQDVDQQYYDALALYYLRYLQEYEKQGIKIDYLCLFNEPGAYTKIPFASIRKLLRDHVGPLLAKHGVKTKIMPCETQFRRQALAQFPLFTDDAETQKYVGALPYHAYDLKDSTSIGELHRRYPNVPLWMTEVCYCACNTPKRMTLPHGGFDDGDFWGNQIVSDIESGASAWIYWNMILDENGGPWAISPVHGNPDPNAQQPVVIVNRETKEVSYTGLYYYLAHFSKYVRPGAVRVRTAGSEAGLRCIAFKGPEQRMVVQLLNSRAEDAVVRLKRRGRELSLKLPAVSITTCRWDMKHQ